LHVIDRKKYVREGKIILYLSTTTGARGSVVG
jgi:hypothetical protein